MKKTWVVVPCYNEAARLNPEAFEGALKRNPQLGFVMVDDGSRDGTLDLLDSLRLRLPTRFEVVALERNSGKAEAVRRGVLHAFSIGAELTGYWDADLATPLYYIDSFAEQLQQEHLVMAIGSRVKMLGRQVERSPIRHYVGRCFGTVAGIALGLPVYDTQCGAKLFKTIPALRSAFEKPFTLRWSFDVEFLGRLLERQHAVGDIDVEGQCTEVPLQEWHDAPGSKLTIAAVPSVAFEMTKLLVSVSRARRRRG